MSYFEKHREYEMREILRAIEPDWVSGTLTEDSSDSPNPLNSKGYREPRANKGLAANAR
jgi:hypothetical protein